MASGRVLDFHWVGDELHLCLEDGRQVSLKNCVAISCSDMDSFLDPTNKTGFLDVKFSFDYSSMKSK